MTPATSLGGGCSQHGPFVVQHRPPYSTIPPNTAIPAIRVLPLGPMPSIAQGDVGVAMLAWGNNVPNIPLLSFGCTCSLMTDLNGHAFGLGGVWMNGLGDRASQLPYPPSVSGFGIAVQPLFFVVPIGSPGGATVPTPGSCDLNGVHVTAGPGFWVVLP